ncbi:7992_t:CDS:1, partial [Acaulospora morrowiae]
LEELIKNMETKINVLWNWWNEPQEEQENQQTSNKSTNKQQMQYQDTEEMSREEEETPLAIYKAINKEAAKRQDKLERQMKQMGKILSELLENGQLPSNKKRQQHER